MVETRGAAADGLVTVGRLTSERPPPALKEELL
jgi:hypothetical protein